MNTVYSTIITADHLHYALAVHRSVSRTRIDVAFKIFVVGNDLLINAHARTFAPAEIIPLSTLCHNGYGKQIHDKYAIHSLDNFRWSMKPVVLNHLLSAGYEQAFFLDPDLYFFSDCTFLESDLMGNAVLLTPHWRSLRPEVDEANFACLQTSGLFNAGFIGVSKAGRPAMDWWANACLYRCEKLPEEGLFVDQAYLDLLPAYFEGVAIERHRGCNVANWNRVECERVRRKDGSVGVRGGWDIVFIHFTQSTIQGILSGEDPLLNAHLAEYSSALDESRIVVERSAPNWAGALRPTHVVPAATHMVSGDAPVAPHTPTFHATTMDVFHIRTGIKNALNSALPLLEGTVLDVGCGHQPYKSMVLGAPSRATRYIGLDLENNPIHHNKPDLLWKEGRIPLEASSVDCAICTEVLEHCPDPEAVLREVNRVLKPNGLLFLTVPFLWPLHEVPYDHYRYTPFSLARHLSNSGFGSIQIKALGGWDASLAQLLGLWVRRRPMPGWIRACLSAVLLPVVWLLLKFDSRRPPEFCESAMITGFSGIARRQNFHDRAE